MSHLNPWTEKAIDYTERVAAIEDRIKREVGDAAIDPLSLTADAVAGVPGNKSVAMRRKLAGLRALRAGLIAKALRADRISARPTHVAAEKARAKGRAA